MLSQHCCQLEQFDSQLQMLPHTTCRIVDCQVFFLLFRMLYKFIHTCPRNHPHCLKICALVAVEIGFEDIPPVALAPGMAT